MKQTNKKSHHISTKQSHSYLLGCCCRIDAQHVTDTIVSMADARKKQAQSVINNEIARVQKIVDGYGPLSEQDKKAIEEGKKLADV